MDTLNLSIELPFKIGDKIWIDGTKGFGSCNFMDRYKKVKEAEITNISVSFNLTENKTEITYTLAGENFSRLYDGFVAFTKEQYYERFRKEIEELIPEDLRNYLWNNK